MFFSDTANGTGSTFTKIAIVSALHVAVGAALIHNMDSKLFSMPEAVQQIVLFTPEMAEPPPPPPPEPPQPKPKSRMAPVPEIYTPPVEVDVPAPPTVDAPLRSASEPTPAAVPAESGPAMPETLPATPSANTGTMFSAALANADACAKPDYPARALRNGETGTVQLALLIGINGRVTDSKVQRSSGSRELDRAAQTALALCQFKPAMQGGVAQAGWGQMAYVWTLD